MPITLSTNLWPEVSLALRDRLIEKLPELITAVNLVKFPEAPVVLPPGPETVELAISNEILDNTIPELPAVCVGVYQRKPIAKMEQTQVEVEQEGFDIDGGFAAIYHYPAIIEVYLGHLDRKVMFKQAIKWGVMLETFVQQFGNTLVPGMTVVGPPDSDATAVLKKRIGYRQLLQVQFNLVSAE